MRDITKMVNKKNLMLPIAIFIFINFLPPIFAADVYKPYLHNPIVPEHPNLNIQGKKDLGKHNIEEKSRDGFAINAISPLQKIKASGE